MEGSILKVENLEGSVFLTVKIDNPCLEKYHSELRNMVRFSIIPDKTKQSEFVADFEKAKKEYNEFLKTINLGKIKIEYIK